MIDVEHLDDGRTRYGRMSARPKAEGLRDVLLVALTVSTGAVDALSWLGLGKVFSAFMTGNFVFLGFRTAGADGPNVPRTLAALGAFGLGAFLAGRIVASTRNADATWPRRVTAAIAASLAPQVAFLALWLATGTHPSAGSADALIALSALAMGMQTAAIFALGVRAVFTTAATATWTVLMGDLSGWSQSRGERLRLAAVIAGLFVGAVVGSLLVLHAPDWAAVLPLVVTASVVAVAALQLHPATAGGRPARLASKQTVASAYHRRVVAVLTFLRS
jgi:uncharacterized membrane protein YoaK (UPF0700 family)